MRVDNQILANFTWFLEIFGGKCDFCQTLLVKMLIINILKSDRLCN
jgi:hypothetical protein